MNDPVVVSRSLGRNAQVAVVTDCCPRTNQVTLDLYGNPGESVGPAHAPNCPTHSARWRR